MLPDSVLSTSAVPGAFLFPRNAPVQPLICYEWGGTDIEDAARGLHVKVWKGEYIEGQIVVSAEGVAPTAILAVAGVSEFQFTFDRNMRPFVVYQLTDGTIRYYWYDTVVADFVTSTLPAGTFTARCAHDDTRDLSNATSDIILAYFRGTSLYFRAQRERYLTEHLLSNTAGAGLVQIGMNRRMRFQFQTLPI